MLAVIAAAVLAAAGTSAIPDKAPLPPFTVGYEPSTVDERGIWMEADESERKLRDSKSVIHDESLNRYIKDVLCRTVGAERCRGARVYVQEVPAFNASMAPNGTMVVWSGLLLRVRSEAELAAVLGHEFAHFELRHTVAAFKQRRNATDIAAWAVVLGGLTNTDTRDLQQSLYASMFRYSREEEQEADLLGFKYLAAAGYPTVAAPDLWKHLMAEQDASAIGRGQKPKHRYEAGFFDDHPTDLKRAEYLTQEAEKIGDMGRDPRAAELRAAVAPLLPRLLEAQIKLNDFGGTEYILEQHAADRGWTGDLLFARGELYRLRGNPRDIAASVDFYHQALAAGYSNPQLQRNLGLSLLRNGQLTEGTAVLSEYLRLSPDANDAKAIKALIGK